MAAAFQPPITRRPWLRFTIGELFVWTFVVGVGLARWRLPDATVVSASLASLSAWLLVGLVSSLDAALRRCGKTHVLSRQAGWFLALDIACSLVGMLFCMLIIGAGLIHRRPPAMTTASELMACFGAWLMAGMVQRSVWGAGQFYFARESGWQARWGPALSCALPLGNAVLIAVVGIVSLREGIDLPGDWYEAQGISVLAYVLFFLAIICAYWQPRQEAAFALPEPRRVRWIREGALLTVGILWAAVVLFNPGMFVALMHIAIRGVESYQPTRWANKSFYPADFSLGVSDAFFVGALCAASLLLAAPIATWLAIRWWNVRRTRYGLLIVATLCIATVVALLVWFEARLLPEFSPILATGVREQRLGAFALAIVLAMAVATILALWFTKGLPPKDSLLLPAPATPKQFLHEHPAVIAVGLLGGMMLVIRDLSQRHWGSWGWLGLERFPGYGPLMDYLIEQPFKMIGVAAIIVLGQRLWAWWRGQRTLACVAWQVEPGRFAIAWLGALITLVLLPPVAAWCGCAILLRLLPSA